jgi:enolase-phosphatase E1
VTTLVHGVRAVLLDLEGTTTPADFVSERLARYAADRVGDFLEAHAADVAVRADALALVTERERETEPDAPVVDEADPDTVAAYARWLIERDRKSTTVKSLAGRICEAGFEAGELTADMFDDVGPALERWRAGGVVVATFSSRSPLMQRLLFEHSSAGDVSGGVTTYFDTNFGSKTDAASYGRIAEALGAEPSAILFVSDSPAELDAAREAGMRIALAVRPGNPLVRRPDLPSVMSLAALVPTR